ncbi:MAG: uncharacterized protein KVP18_003993 [Porospora cf. gigantea A]|uniref:uncharacterized protein n=1 Tax=Porospora cf. gigantea A TaxID=2853593 RepID=UPI00355982D1|nr:MAG: hypothetical protein KVP18_003993 [Porospora cf. gigantea A]
MDLPTLLFEDRIAVKSIDTSKFERVARIKGKTSAFEADISLDVNTDLFPVQEKQVITIAIADQICAIPNKTGIDVLTHKLPSLLEQYDYVMHGRVFRVENKSGMSRTLYASFGGLLLSIQSDAQTIAGISIDQRIYILLSSV